MTTTTLPALRPWRSSLRHTPASAAATDHGVAWSVHVEDAGALRGARRLLRNAVLDVLAVASPVHPSEVVRARASSVPAVRISPLLAEVLDTALRAAAATDGAYDPTVAPLPHLPASPLAGCGGSVVPSVRAQWREVVLDGDILRLPPAGALDLLPVAAAVAARRAAARIVEALGCGAYVVVGDSAAAEGMPRPVSLWGMPMRSGDSAARLRVSTDTWSEVCVRTSDASAAALARAAYAWGAHAPRELAARGASARLMTSSGSVVLV